MIQKVKKTLLMLAMVVATCIVTTSCGTKWTAMNDLRKFTAEVDANGADYTVEDWKAAAAEYQKIDKRLAQYEYTQEEVAEISRLKGECTGSFVRNVTTNLAGKVQTGVTAVKSFLEGIKEAFGGWGK